MKFELYTLEKDEKLSDIAKKFAINVDILKRVNPDMKSNGGFLLSTSLVSKGQSVRIPIKSNSLKSDIKEKTQEEKIHFNQKARYRCEQLNITKVEDDIKSYSEIKKEYDVKYNLKENLLFIKLLDFIYEFNPPALSRVFDFVSEVDYIRHNSLVKVDSNGRFESVRNKHALRKNWENFKNKELKNIEFIKVIKESRPDEYKNLIQAGNVQFSEIYNDKKDFDRDLFYLTLLDKYLYESPESLGQEEYLYQSQLFPNLEVPMNVNYHILNQNENILTIKKVMETKESEELLKNLEESYNTYHKPQIKYKFSKYKLSVRNLFTYNIDTKLLEKADFTILESVENNIKSECMFNVRKLKDE